MNLKQLKSFVAVAETGSLSRASDRLRLAQAAMSRQISLLEYTVGRELFIRSSRGMQLSDAGRELFARVAGLLVQLERSIDDVRSLSTTPSGYVALGMMPSVSTFFAGRVAVRVAAELPKVSLRIVEGYTGHLIDWLQRGELDVSLLYGPAADYHLRMTDLLHEELVLVGTPGSSLLAQSSVALSSLSQVKLVLPSSPHGLRLVVEKAAKTARTKLDIAFEADSFAVLKDLAKAGLGYTILPLSAISLEHQLGMLGYTQISQPKVRREVVLGLPANRTDTRATKAVASLVLDEIGELLQSGRWKAQPSREIKALMTPVAQAVRPPVAESRPKPRGATLRKGQWWASQLASLVNLEPGVAEPQRHYCKLVDQAFAEDVQCNQHSKCNNRGVAKNGTI